MTATGATDAQIEAAKQATANYTDVAQSAIRAAVAHAVRVTIPPGHVIAPAEHVTDAADREAIRLAAKFTVGELLHSRYYGEANSQTDHSEWQRLADISQPYFDQARAAEEEITPEILARLERLRGSGNR